MIPINLSSLTANGSSPRFDPAFPTGNRPIPTLIASADFSNGQLVPPSVYAGVNWYQWTDSQAGMSTTIEAGAIRFNYPITDAGYSGLGVQVDPLNIKEVFVTFRAKMPNAKNGIKFFKVFGKNATGGSNTVANCTFTLDYTGVPDGKGTFTYIGFGDGTTNSNDTQNGVFYDGGAPTVIGRSYGVTAQVYTIGRNFTPTDWGTGWHNFRFHVKFNDGTSAQNEVANGSFYSEVDGVVYANATGLFNRHWSNGDIDRVEFAGWTQGNGPAFDLHYDDIKVSLGGWPP